MTEFNLIDLPFFLHTVALGTVTKPARHSEWKCGWSAEYADVLFRKVIILSSRCRCPEPLTATFCPTMWKINCWTALTQWSHGMPWVLAKLDTAVCLNTCLVPNNIQGLHEKRECRIYVLLLATVLVCSWCSMVYVLNTGVRPLFRYWKLFCTFENSRPLVHVNQAQRKPLFRKVQLVV